MTSHAEWGSAELEALAARLDRVRHELESVAQESRRAFANVVWNDVARDELDREVRRLDADLTAVVVDVSEQVAALRRGADRRSAGRMW